VAAPLLPAVWCIGWGLTGGLSLPGTYWPMKEPSSVNWPPGNEFRRKHVKKFELKSNNFEFFEGLEFNLDLEDWNFKKRSQNLIEQFSSIHDQNLQKVSEDSNSDWNWDPVG
jgi:hypothetical protein